MIVFKRTNSNYLLILTGLFFAAISSKEDDNYRTLYYLTQHTKSEGETSRDEITPLI
ncbi:MAG: hypothetical protein COA86_15730 [Kangiella sp.]|nr:MAG: hypothetical protein COA86_15730 [Kangiella sp.]